MSDETIAAAQVRVARARNSLTEALSALKERLLPGNIARNLAHGIAERGQDAAQAGVDAVKARPATALGIAALAGLFLARKPIARALAPENGHESDEPDATPPAPPRSPARPSSRKGSS